MSSIPLSWQERRELFEEYIVHFRKGEIGAQTFRGRCMEAGIDKDEVDAVVERYLKDNVSNWRAR